MGNFNNITIIIPTTAETSRLESLECTIKSCLAQKNVNPVPLVYLNGNRHSASTFKKLNSDDRIRFFYNELPSLPNSIHEARKCVDTEYFCFVDDDDLLIEDTLSIRLAPFLQDSNIDAVIGNGFKQHKNQPLKQLYNNIEQYKDNPLVSLMTTNWLASCGGLYKTASIDESFFDPKQKYYEWSYVAYKLAQKKILHFIDTPVFIVNVTDDSLSHSESYITELPHFLTRLLKEEAPPVLVKSLLKARIAKANNYVSNYYLNKRMFKQSLNYHLKCSFTFPEGLFYQSWWLKFLKKIIFRQGE